MSARLRSLKLPQLLSQLPADGAGALVRPSTAPNAVYRITRTKLKFRAKETEAEGAASGDGELRVSGKVWGMKFLNGRYIPHTESKSALVKPDSLIRGSLKERWTQVSEEDLSQESRQAIKTKVDDLAAKKA